MGGTKEALHSMNDAQRLALWQDINYIAFIDMFHVS